MILVQVENYLFPGRIDPYPGIQDGNLKEWVQILDVNRDGTILWSEFNGVAEKISDNDLDHVGV
jgi:hypothetical protein